jgi:hypothetical protein
VVVIVVKADPLFNLLRFDGRVESLLKRMNLPSNGAGTRSN